MTEDEILQLDALESAEREDTPCSAATWDAIKDLGYFYRDRPPTEVVFTASNQIFQKIMASMPVKLTPAGRVRLAQLRALRKLMS